MLDIHQPETPRDEKNGMSTQVRHGPMLGRKIERAARYLGVDKSTFLRSAVDKEASRIIEAQTRYVMTPEDAKVFAAALDRPPRATPRAVAAVEAYRARVIYAD